VLVEPNASGRDRSQHVETPHAVDDRRHRGQQVHQIAQWSGDARGEYRVKKIAIPSATGIASTSANSDTNTVTWNNSNTPKCIAEVSVVIQFPPRRKFASLRDNAGMARQQEQPDRPDQDDDQDSRPSRVREYPVTRADLGPRRVRGLGVGRNDRRPDDLCRTLPTDPVPARDSLRHLRLTSLLIGRIHLNPHRIRTAAQNNY
jgi:hypothetical protein